MSKTNAWHIRMEMYDFGPNIRKEYLDELLVKSLVNANMEVASMQNTE